MEERMEYAMTNEQWDGMIKMFAMMVMDVRDPDKILQRLECLIKDKAAMAQVLKLSDQGPITHKTETK